MTLGTWPEALTLGYLRNQRLVEDLEEIRSVDVDWDREQVNVSTFGGEGIIDWEQKLSKRTVTTGCGQGTVFSCTLDKLYEMRLPEVRLTQSSIYGLLKSISSYNEIYKQAGAVHGCALCRGTEIITFIEDVGRHNAADAISGLMWLDRVSGADKIFYTTGRLTSEIVMKAAHMGIPAILSRSGVTHMGLELAGDLGVIMIARAKGRHFLVYNGADRIEFDAVPRAPAGAGRPVHAGDAPPCRPDRPHRSRLPPRHHFRPERKDAGVPPPLFSMRWASTGKRALAACQAPRRFGAGDAYRRRRRPDRPALPGADTASPASHVRDLLGRSRTQHGHPQHGDHDPLEHGLPALVARRTARGSASGHRSRADDGRRPRLAAGHGDVAAGARVLRIP